MPISPSASRSLPDLLARPECGLLVIGLLLPSGLVVAARAMLQTGEPEATFRAILLLYSGLILGAFLAFIQRHPRRRLGLVPIGSLGAGFIALGFALTDGKVPESPVLAVLIGLGGGLAGFPLLSAALARVWPEWDRPGGCFTVVFVVLAIPLLLFGGPAQTCITLSLDPRMERLVLAHCSLVLTLWSWALFFPHTVDLLFEMLMAPMFRIRAHGPGMDAIPRRGPVILIANHSSYFDPFWVGKLVPRKLRPMMTSRFFDLPLLRWLMVAAVQAIRVEATRVRRQVPELQEALAVLRQGGCLMIFPEGRLRRTEEQLLQPFGQGVWHLLKELPETPVVVLWIEGGWGSFLSYWKGPPGQNKRLDLGRRIEVALSAPRVLAAEVLADQRGTRRFLERACLECRAYLGLPVPPAEREDGESQVSQASKVTPAGAPGMGPHQIDL